MARQLTTDDILIEQNRDGNFLYIRPETGAFAAKTVISDVVLDNVSNSPFGDTRGGVVVSTDNVLIDNLSVTNAKNGIAINPSDNLRIYDYTFFETKEGSEIYATAIYRRPDHRGAVEIQRAYADGLDKTIKNTSDYYLRNTEFFDNNNIFAPTKTGAVYMRDFTARGFADAIIDAKSTVYVMNATLEDAYRVIRAWSSAHVVLVNCEINIGTGKAYGWLEGYNTRISYYNCLWDGKPTADLSKFQTYAIPESRSAETIAKNVRELTTNPLAGIPFFSTDPNRYRVQVSVNNDAWIDVPLPKNGRFDQVIGDTLVELPALGNGIYEVRSWVQNPDGASTPVSTRVFEVVDNGFDYAGGRRAPNGGPGADYIAGLGSLDIISAGGGNDTVLGSSGDDSIDGGTGDDELTGGPDDDTLLGGAGDDTLDGGSGDDSLEGGDGDDLLIGGPGNDTLLGGVGDDTLRPSEDVNLIVGGPGFDTIDLSNQRLLAARYVIDMNAQSFRPASSAAATLRFSEIERVIGTPSADRIIGTRSGDRFEGGRGDDTLEGNAGRDVYVFDPLADFGNDVITAFQSDDALWFTRFVDPGMDKLFFLDAQGVMKAPGMGGTIRLPKPNGFVAYAGENSEGYHVYEIAYIPRPAIDIPATVPAHANPTIRTGGAGRDTLAGGAGPDRLNGLGGNDLLRGGGGADALFGGDGDDTLEGGDGPDWLQGGTGRDVLRGGPGTDTIEGGDGDDRIVWSGFGDAILGGAGTDTLDFSEAASAGLRVDLQTQTVRSLAAGSNLRADIESIERVVGSSGNDHLIGLRTADRLTGGLGNDTLDGAAGTDVYIFDNRTFFGKDKVLSFQSDDALWFTDFLDPGPDRVIFLNGAGRLSVPTPGGTATIDTIYDNRMMRYQGANAEGFHVYTLDYASRPARDLPGTYVPKAAAVPDAVLVVRAGGDSAPDEGAKFRVRVGGVQIGETEVAPLTTHDQRLADGITYNDYVFRYDPALRGGKIEIDYFNDRSDSKAGFDINLFVDRIERDGQILQAEKDGYFQPSNPALSAFEGPREALWFNGVLEF